MDFFARQERSRRTTRFLIVAFALSFTAIVLATTFVTAVVLRLYSGSENLFVGGGTFGQWAGQHVSLLALVALGTLLSMLLASLYRTATLARGGSQVARMLGGTEVTGDTTDPLRKRLVNVVEEMAIASGLPVPDIYVLEQESGINAFAAGLTPSDAAIAMTRGALERLDRAELQAVAAHEVSHIVNGDMRLNQRLMGLSFGILVLSLVGRWLLRAARFGRRGRNSGGTAAAVGLGAAFALIGGIGLLASRMIKASVSRQRELLADASAVQFTRESSALASALKKIGGYNAKITSVDSEEVAHMLFERASPAFRGWFATHPPLEERIRVLDPSFRPGDFTAPSLEAEAGADYAAEHVRPLAAATASAGESLLERVGEMEAPGVGGALREALPEALYGAAHSHESSLLLVVAMALSSEARLRAEQQAFLQAQLGSARAQRCIRLRGELDGLDEGLRIPLLELAMPALKQRPPEQLDFLVGLVKRVLALDSEQRLFDYVLLRMLTAYLADLPGPTPGAAPGGARSGPRQSARAAAAAVLAAVAVHGHQSADAAEGAFLAGLAALGGAADEGGELAFAAFEPRDLARLDDALLRLKKLRPRGKRALLRAVLATIRHDRRVDVAEIELFRAIAATLGCPVPPSAASARVGLSEAADTQVRFQAASAAPVGLPTGDA